MAEGDFGDPPPLDGDVARHNRELAEKRPPFDPSEAELVGRDEKTDTYRNEDGSFTTLVHAAPVNWQDASGEWQPIDVRLAADDRGDLAPRSSPLAVRLAGEASGTDLGTISGEGWSLSFGLEGAAGKAAQAAKDTARYPEVLEGVDLEYRVGADHLKEVLVLSGPPEPGEDVRFVFPLRLEGLWARTEADGSIVFADAGGEAVLSVPQGVMWEHRSDEELAAAPSPEGSAPVKVALAETPAGPVLVVDPDEGWLAAPERHYPVRVDPTFWAGRASGHWDAFVWSLFPDTNYNGQAQIDGNAYVDKIGETIYGTLASYVKYDLSAMAGKNILDADWYGFFYSSSAFPNWFAIYPVAGGWSDSTVTWNTRPDVVPEIVFGETTAADQWVSRDITTWAQSWVAGSWANHGVALAAPYYFRMAAAEAAGIVDPVKCGVIFQTCDSFISVTYNTPPPASAPTGPANGSIQPSARPTLTSGAVTDGDGDPVKYWYRVATSDDAVTGQTINSGWLDSPSWQIPEGSLRDGVTYWWRVYTWDGVSVTDQAVAPWKFRVNLRLGAQAVSPMDPMGPVQVNLGNGNLVTGTGSPAFASVGGPLGLSYSYNSQAEQAFGLVGSYYWDGMTEPQVVKTESEMSFNWGSDPPDPAITADYFTVRWRGFVTVPYKASNWYFGAVHDDSVTIKVDGQTVLDATGVSTTAQYGLPSNLNANQTVPIEIDFHEVTGNAFFQLYVMGPVSEQEVPPNWLSYTTQLLPQGWQLSGGPAAALRYNTVLYATNGVVLFEPSGVAHPYLADDPEWIEHPNATPGYRSLDGDGSVIVRRGFFLDVFTSAGVQYTFDVWGKLSEIHSTLNDLNPAAAQFGWDTAEGTHRLEWIRDPVSQRQIELRYSADPYQIPPPPPCPTADGFVPAPAGMLCQVTYWDGTVTKLFYNGDGQLARIEDPGGEVTDFGYANGRLSRIRDPLAADVVAAGLRANDDTTRTVIAYDASGRVSSVTAPAPTAGASRPGHTYEYTTAWTETRVHVAGLSEPNGYARRVTLDGAGRISTDTDATGRTTAYEWDPSEDRVLSVADAAGLKTTTIYDAQDRPTDTYGPVPASWFGSDRRPLSQHAAQTPHSTTAYDQDITGLAGAYWDNEDQSGPIELHTWTRGDGVNYYNEWSGSPGTNIGTDHWSATFTGELFLPATGTYTLRLWSDDGSRLYLDDALVTGESSWTDGPGFRDVTVQNPNGPAWHRIRIDLREATGTASVGLKWVPPGGAEGWVPTANLTPRYDLVTSTTDADGRRVDTEYAQPHLGLATAVAVDPAGLNLRTTATYESTYYRRASKTLPRGAATTITDTYYGDTETRARPADCGGGSAVSQAGLSKLATDADPDGAGAQQPVQRERIYDAAGRVVAERVVGDVRWSCISYDARGRVASSTDVAGRTTTNDYSTAGVVVTGFEDSAGGARTTRTEVDLLGRTIRYVDEQGAATRYVYDQPGRQVASYRTLPGGGEAQLTATVYDAAGRVTSSTEYASGTGRTTTYGYDAAGRLETTTRPNGVTTTNTYESEHGRLAVISHEKDSVELSPWSYGYSLGGKVVAEATAGRTRAFTYDGAGRLVRTDENGSPVRDYAYDANTNRCANASSCATPTYSYDNADRLTASPYGSGYVYDAHGNLTGYDTAGGGSVSIAYDGNDHATTITEQVPSEPVTVTAVDFAGAGSDFLSTPDGAGISVTGDLDVRARVGLDDWTPSEWQYLAAKTGTWWPGSVSYAFSVTSSGKLMLEWSPDGSVGYWPESTVAGGAVDGGASDLSGV
ncbi:MAG: PA14 domain-containing protein [Acidimicrobiia bacterium]|nr:PA14 domain-containing protein [Acidimicrobiia bacterium]